MFASKDYFKCCILLRFWTLRLHEIHNSCSLPHSYSIENLKKIALTFQSRPIGMLIDDDMQTTTNRNRLPERPPKLPIGTLYWICINLVLLDMCMLTLSAKFILLVFFTTELGCHTHKMYALFRDANSLHNTYSAVLFLSREIMMLLLLAYLKFNTTSLSVRAKGSYRHNWILPDIWYVNYHKNRKSKMFVI